MESGCSWKDNNKCDIKQIGCEDIEQIKYRKSTHSIKGENFQVPDESLSTLHKRLYFTYSTYSHDNDDRTVYSWRKCQDEHFQKSEEMNSIAEEVQDQQRIDEAKNELMD